MRLKKILQKIANETYDENNPSTWPELEKAYYHVNSGTTFVSSLIEDLEILLGLENDDSKKEKIQGALDNLKKSHDYLAEL